MLGVEPDEKFKLKKKSKDYFLKSYYKITPELSVICKDVQTGSWLSTTTSIIDFLLDKYEIIKIPKLTKKEQLAIDYARACGYNWIAKDKAGLCFAFKNKPVKEHFKNNRVFHNSKSKLQLKPLFF